MLPCGSGPSDRLLLVVGIVCMLAILSAAPADAGYCMDTGLEDLYKNGSWTHIQLIFKSQMDKLTLTKCKDPNHKCIECTPLSKKSQYSWQLYTAFCAAERPSGYGCTHAPTMSCSSQTESGCFPQLETLRKMLICIYRSTKNGQLLFPEDDIYCADSCASGIIYDKSNTLMLSSCANHTKLWMEYYKRYNPLSKLRTKYCENSSTCRVEVRLKPKANRKSTRKSSSASSASSSSSASSATSRNSSNSGSTQRTSSLDRAVTDTVELTAAAEDATHSLMEVLSSATLRSDRGLQLIGLVSVCSFMRMR